MKYIILLIMIMTGFVSVNAQTIVNLQQCRERALANNVRLRNSKLESDAAMEVKKNAFTSYFPKVSVTAFGMKAVDPLINMQIPGGNLPVYDGNPANIPNATQFAYVPDISVQLMQKAALGAVNVVQPVYVGGKIVTGNKLAQINLEVKEKQEKLTENEVLLIVEQQYWQLVVLQEKEKTLLQYEILLQSIDKQVRDAFNSGLSIRNDVLKVRVKMDELALNKNKLKNGKKMAIMQLCNTIGIEYDSTLVLEEPLQVVEIPENYFLSSDTIINNRLEYQLLEQSVEAARLQTKMKTGDYLPQLAIGVNGSYFNPLEKGARGTSNAILFATISIPVSDWWGGSHVIQEQRIREQIAQNTFDDTKQLLNLQVEKARNDIQEAYEKVQILQHSEIQINENLKVSQSSYSSGISTLSELLEAQAMKTEVTNNLIEAKAQYRLAVTTYLQVAGR